jgi:hypothetical protein
VAKRGKKKVKKVVPKGIAHVQAGKKGVKG